MKTNRRGFFGVVAAYWRRRSSLLAKMPLYPINRRCWRRFPPIENEALDCAVYGRAAAEMPKSFTISAGFRTPREMAENLPHDLSGVTASVTAVRHPLRIEVAPSQFLKDTRRAETIEAWRVETLKRGGRRVWCTNGEFQSYSPTAHFQILPDKLRSGESGPLRQLSVYRDF